MSDIPARTPPGEDAPVVIAVKGLVSRFGDHVVHDGVDLSVARGEALGHGAADLADRRWVAGGVVPVHRLGADGGRQVDGGGQVVRRAGAHLDLGHHAPTDGRGARG